MPARLDRGRPQQRLEARSVEAPARAVGLAHEVDVRDGRCAPRRAGPIRREVAVRAEARPDAERLEQRGRRGREPVADEGARDGAIDHQDTRAAPR